MIFQLLFFIKLKTHLIHCSFPPESVFTYISEFDLSGIVQASLVVLSHTHFAIIHPYFIHANCYFI